MQPAAHERVSRLRIKDGAFADDLGRTILLRGVNMSANSKLPIQFTAAPDYLTKTQTKHRDSVHTPQHVDRYAPHKHGRQGLFVETQAPMAATNSRQIGVDGKSVSSISRQDSESNGKNEKMHLAAISETRGELPAETYSIKDQLNAAADAEVQNIELKSINIVGANVNDKNESEHVGSPANTQRYSQGLAKKEKETSTSTPIIKNENAESTCTYDFYNHTTVSFTNRPFPLHEADTHFSRLRSWGLTFIRLLVPWEALEHTGPGIYDAEYISYLIALIKLMPRYGIQCFIDPHQDTWSRFTGGSGAPGWTFAKVGLDLRNFSQTGAAYLHDFNPNTTRDMLWPSNYTKLACATMFTVFFGGHVFTPLKMVDGVNVGTYLRNCYYNCFANLARKLKGLHAIVGFEAINEPHPGYIGIPDITMFNPMKDLHLACAPTALQSWALGSGISQEVDYYVKSWPIPTKKAGKRILNEKNISAWLPGHECLWKQHGVWKLDASNTPKLLLPTYFSRTKDGAALDFYRDFYVPFLTGFADAINAVDESAFFFFEPIPNEHPPTIPSDAKWLSSAVYAPHWYDLSAVFSKSFTGYITHDVQGLSKGTRNIFQATYFGLFGARRNYTMQIRNVVEAGLKKIGKTPCIIGECGIPMDLNSRGAFESGDYTHHTNFLDAVISSLDANLVSFTLWNYNALNSNELGDMWNGEDFSVFTSQDTDTFGQAAESLVRISKQIQAQRELSELETGTPLTSIDPGVKSAVCARRFSFGKRETSKLSSPALNERQKSYQTPHTPFEISQLDYRPPTEKAHIGGRALDAIIRPYAVKIAGTPKLMRFILKTKEFHFEFETRKLSTDSKPALSNTTEIYVPLYHYKNWGSFNVTVTDGEWIYIAEKETIYWTVDPRVDMVEPRTWWNGSKNLADTNTHVLKIIRAKTTSRSWGIVYPSSESTNSSPTSNFSPKEESW